MEKHVTHVVASDSCHTRQDLRETGNNGRLSNSLETGQLTLRLNHITTKKMTKDEVDDHHRPENDDRGKNHNDHNVGGKEEEKDERTVEVSRQVGVHRVEIFRETVEDAAEGHPVEELIEGGEEEIADHFFMNNLTHLGRAVCHHQGPDESKRTVYDTKCNINLHEGVIAVFNRFAMLNILVSLTPVLQPHIAVCVDTHPQRLDQEDRSHETVSPVVFGKRFVKTESHLSAVLLGHHELVR